MNHRFGDVPRERGIKSPLGHEPFAHVQLRLNGSLYQSLAWLVGECQAAARRGTGPRSALARPSRCGRSTDVSQG
jgi:hypothetical protein